MKPRPALRHLLLALLYKWRRQAPESTGGFFVTVRFMLDSRFEHRVVLGSEEVQRIALAKEQKQSEKLWADALTVIA